MTAPSASWPFPPQDLVLTSDEIHLWRASLDVSREVVGALAANLVPDEQLRASRFAFACDRDHFVTCRGILRQIIGTYLHCHPSQLAFQHGIHGKPYVCVDQSQAPFHFNLSHSHGLAVYAFSLQREVGIDTEFIRPMFDGEEIAKHYFTPAELLELQQVSSELRAEAFFLGWTRKEAYIKARGAGLHISLDSFSVSLTPRASERLNSDDRSRWRLLSFEPAPQFAGAVVGEGQDWRPRYWDWSFS